MLPKYEQIKQDFLCEMRNHTFIPGDEFYSEADIKREYAVSSVTAVKVLNELTGAGCLYRIQGGEIFVSKSGVPQNIKFSDIELYSLDSEKVKVLSIEEENQAEILKGLGLPANASYYRIKRVRYSEDTLFLIHITRLPKKFVGEPLSKDPTTYVSMYERIRKDFSVDLSSLASVETNEIVFLENVELLNLFQLNFREPAVKQVKHSYPADGSAAGYIIGYEHWEYLRAKMEAEAE